MAARREEGAGQRGRRMPRWAVVVIAIVLVLAVIVGVSVWYQMNPAKTPAAPAPVTVSAPSGDASEIPNGCLAGKDTSAAALIAAQKKAPHTEAGAIGLAAAFSRWSSQYPYPPDADGKSVVAAIASSDADSSIKDIPAQIAAKKPADGWASGGISFAEGRYVVEDSTPDRVKVTVGGAGVKNGLPIPDYKVLRTLALVWQDGAWKIQSASADRTLEDLFTNGAALAGGC